MLIRFGRLASLMGSRIVRIPFSNFVWILLVSIGLGKVIDRSNAPATISRESQLCPRRWRLGESFANDLEGVSFLLDVMRASSGFTAGA